MGARKWHVSRAEYNSKVATSLSSEYPDWEIVALFYSALHYVHSSLADEPGLPKDERHPRKHTAGPDAANGGRGTNQLVADRFGAISVQYRSLYEMSRRSRYDVDKLNTDIAIPLLRRQFEDVRDFCVALNGTRPTIPTQAP